MDAAAQLALAGHPNAFPSKPVATCEQWDLLQKMDTRTLLCSHTLHVGGNVWRDTVRGLCSGVSGFVDLMVKMETMQRTIHPTRDTTVLMWPTQHFMRSVKGLSDIEAVEAARAKSTLYERFFINGDYGTVDLNAALELYESFHVLEALPEKWSPNHLFKCNCESGFKNASCHHVLMATWAVDRSRGVPDRYLGLHVQQRRRRGRPCAKASEIGDVGEAKCRARLELQAQYKAPKVMCFGFKCCSHAF